MSGFRESIQRSIGRINEQEARNADLIAFLQILGIEVDVYRKTEQVKLAQEMLVDGAWQFVDGIENDILLSIQHKEATYRVHVTERPTDSQVLLQRLTVQVEKLRLLGLSEDIAQSLIEQANTYCTDSGTLFEEPELKIDSEEAFLRICTLLSLDAGGRLARLICEGYVQLHIAAEEDVVVVLCMMGGGATVRRAVRPDTGETSVELADRLISLAQFAEITLNTDDDFDEDERPTEH